MLMLLLLLVLGAVLCDGDGDVHGEDGGKKGGGHFRAPRLDAGYGLASSITPKCSTLLTL